MKSLSIKLAVIFIGLLIFGYRGVCGADWKYFAAGGNATFWWYDTQGVTYQPKGIIHVWVKKIKADEIEALVKSRGKFTVSELEQMTLEKDYEKSLMEIDCVEKTIHIRQKYNYDPKGVLKSGESKPVAKQNIPTDSVAEELYKAVCK